MKLRMGVLKFQMKGFEVLKLRIWFLNLPRLVSRPAGRWASALMQADHGLVLLMGFLGAVSRAEPGAVFRQPWQS